MAAGTRAALRAAALIARADAANISTWNTFIGFLKYHSVSGKSTFLSRERPADTSGYGNCVVKSERNYA
jgi:hypothetical protein